MGAAKVDRTRLQMPVERQWGGGRVRIVVHEMSDKQIKRDRPEPGPKMIVEQYNGLDR
jgi:hypothetical protein